MTRADVVAFTVGALIAETVRLYRNAPDTFADAYTRRADRFDVFPDDLDWRVRADD